MKLMSFLFFLALRSEMLKMAWKTELQSAVVNDDMDKFDSILAEHKEDLDSVMEWQEGSDPLHQAAKDGRDEMIKKLLDAGARVNAFCFNER